MSTEAPARYVALPGTTNFRDLGGYVGHEGRIVRWRTLFRSDHLAGLQPEGLQQLQGLQVQRSADFRGVHERSLDSYAWDGVTAHALTVEPTLVQEAFALVQGGGRLRADDAQAMMQATYRSFVREHATAFAQLFRLLLEDASPLVFHCTAGKDRTGWAAALILEALGVARSDIEQDYLLTNRYYQRPAAMAARAAMAMPQDVLQVLWRVQPDFLASAYAMVEQEYGDMANYLRTVMHLDAHSLRELRARYLAALH